MVSVVLIVVDSCVVFTRFSVVMFQLVVDSVSISSFHGVIVSCGDFVFSERKTVVVVVDVVSVLLV